MNSRASHTSERRLCLKAQPFICQLKYMLNTPTNTQKSTSHRNTWTHTPQMRWRWVSNQTRAEPPVPVVHFPFTAVFALLFFSISPKKKKSTAYGSRPRPQRVWQPIIKRMFSRAQEGRVGTHYLKPKLTKPMIVLPFRTLVQNPLMERLCPRRRIYPAYVTMRHSVKCLFV